VPVEPWRTAASFFSKSAPKQNPHRVAYKIHSATLATFVPALVGHDIDFGGHDCRLLLLEVVAHSRVGLLLLENLREHVVVALAELREGSP
jgi:hypothetical protein